MTEQSEQQPSPQPEATNTPSNEVGASLVGGAPADPATPQEPEAAPEAPAALTAEDIALPEGLQADPEIVNGLVETLNADQTPQERAASLLDLHKQVLDQSEKQMQEAWQSTQEEWRKAVKALPEVGGDNLDQTLGDIAKVVDRYGGKEAREALDLTGAGNHPAVVQLFAKLARDLNETPPVSGEPPSGAPKSRAERMFGNQ